MQMKNWKWVAVAVLAMGMAGCGPSSPSTSSGGGSVAIGSFAVTGSYTDANRQTVPISASMNGGQFALDWTVSGYSSFYTVSVAASADQTLDNSDTQFLTRNCGDTSQVYDCGGTGSVTCSFGTDNTLTCGTYDQGDISTLVANGLPANGYLIMKACDGVGSTCDTKAVAVTFE